MNLVSTDTAGSVYLKKILSIEAKKDDTGMCINLDGTRIVMHEEESMQVFDFLKNKYNKNNGRMPEYESEMKSSDIEKGMVIRHNKNTGSISVAIDGKELWLDSVRTKSLCTFLIRTGVISNSQYYFNDDTPNVNPDKLKTITDFKSDNPDNPLSKLTVELMSFISNHLIK